jgi:hypothetical protein
LELAIDSTLDQGGRNEFSVERIVLEVK